MSTPADETFSLRAAQESDLSSIARLQARSWRDAYSPLLPADFLGASLDERLAAHWSRLPGQGWRVEVVEAREQIIGFAAARLDAEGRGHAYLDNLHVAPDSRRGGLGRALMRHLARRLIEAGQLSMHLTVLTGNRDARAFYRAMGGREGPETGEEMHGLPVRVHRVDWDDLQRLAAGIGPAEKMRKFRDHPA